MISPNNYVNIQGWMITNLKLKGNELLVYAIIYGFSQDGINWFAGTLSYLAQWCNSTTRGIQKNLASLLEKNLIIKKEVFDNNVKYCKYQANLEYLQSSPVVNKVPGGIEQSSRGGRNKVPGGIEQSSYNNINNNINNNAINISTASNIYSITSKMSSGEKDIKEKKEKTQIENIKETKSITPASKKANKQHILVKDFIENKVEDSILRRKIFAIFSNRVQANKPITLEFAKLFLVDLEKYSNGDYNKKLEVLDQSISRGYFTLFELSTNSIKYKHYKSNNPSDNSYSPSYDLSQWENNYNIMDEIGDFLNE